MSKAAELAALIGSQTALSNRNLIINGAMQVAQRGTSTSSVTGNGYHACDRWKFDTTDESTLTISQATDVPSGKGFANSFKMDVTVAESSVASDDQTFLNHRIEGQNLQQLKKGTSSAESVTVSFYVKSTKTGTFCLELEDKDNSRHISKQYSVSASDTWEFKTITFDGDTTGTLDNDNGESLRLKFWLVAGSDFTSGTLATSWASITNANAAVGQVNAFDSTSNNWLITGIQLEVGEQATPFEHRSFADELIKCQRYFELIGYALGRAVSTTQAEVNSAFKVDKRAAPTITLKETSSAIAEFLRSAANITSLDSTYNSQTTHCGNRLTSSDTGMNSGELVSVIKPDSLAADAEL